MPFTIAHAAAAPPLWRLTRRRLVLSAVVVGSMAPDFEYLVHLSARRTIGHTPLGLVVMCLPASLAVLAAWHRLLGPALAHLVPARAAAVAAVAGRSFTFWPLGRFAHVAGSAFVGSLTHVGSDAFTHRHGAVVVRVGFLDGPLWAGGPPGYQALQYASSVAGSILLAWWLRRLANRPGPHASPPPPVARLRAPVAIALGATTALAATANAVRAAAGGSGLKDIVVAGIIAGLAAGLAGALAASVAVRRARFRPATAGCRVPRP